MDKKVLSGLGSALIAVAVVLVIVGLIARHSAGYAFVALAAALLACGLSALMIGARGGHGS